MSFTLEVSYNNNRFQDWQLNDFGLVSLHVIFLHLQHLYRSVVQVKNFQGFWIGESNSLGMLYFYIYNTCTTIFKIGN